jgi:hypothetical protein
MAYGSNITTSVLGRRLGLQIMSTAQTGSANGAQEFIVGPSDIRLGASTADTTSTATKPHGITILKGTSAASTPVYSLDPPVIGVKKIIAFGSTDSALYIKTANGEYIWGTSLGSSATVIRSSGGGCVELMGLTTAIWAALNISSTAVNTVAFQATT